MSNEELYNILKIKDSMIDELIKKLDNKENIIKEVREYIENNKQYAELEDYGKNGEYYIDEIGLLQILDKENKD